MLTNVLFIHGGGDDGYEADRLLASSLQKELGEDYELLYPKLNSDESAADFGWLSQIGHQIEKLDDGSILAGHSLGASFLLKWLSENELPINPSGIFLLATPFWQGEEDWKQGLKLPDGYAKKIPESVPLYFYHCEDDEEVGFNHLSVYRRHLPNGIFREVEKGGHQFNNDLGLVATDMKAL